MLQRDEEFSTMINYGKNIWTQEIVKSDKYINLLICSILLFEQNKKALSNLKIDAIIKLKRGIKWKDVGIWRKEKKNVWNSERTWK